jgi:hypothetical protein
VLSGTFSRFDEIDQRLFASQLEPQFQLTAWIALVHYIDSSLTVTWHRLNLACMK